MEAQSHWIITRGIRFIWQRFRTAWQRLDEATWKSWLYTLTIGWIASGLLAYLLAILGRWLSTAGYLEWDVAALNWLTDTVPISFAMAMYFGVIGDSAFLFTLVPAAAIVAIWRGHPLRALTIMASLLMTDVVVGVSWLTWNRARPDILYDGIAAPGLHSFPSGHTVQAIVVYGLLAYLWIRETRFGGERVLVLLGYAAIVAIVIVTRLALGTHWPSDIIGAVPLGVVWLLSLILSLHHAAQRAAKQNQPYQSAPASCTLPQIE